MIITLKVDCTSCGKDLEVEFDSVKHKATGLCGHCGTDNGHPVDRNFHVGHSLIAYASSAIKKDPNLTILFAGIAVDSYLSHIFLKWRDIEELNSRKIAYDPVAVRESLYVELRGLRTFIQKSKRVIKLTYPKGIDSFFLDHPALADKINNGFPNIPTVGFLKHIEKELLWKRNDVAHVGQIAYSKTEGVRAVYYAKTFIAVFEEMEKWARKNRNV